MSQITPDERYTFLKDPENIVCFIHRINRTGDTDEEVFAAMPDTWECYEDFHIDIAYNTVHKCVMIKWNRKGEF